MEMHLSRQVPEWNVEKHAMWTNWFSVNTSDLRTIYEQSWPSQPPYICLPPTISLHSTGYSVLNPLHQIANRERRYPKHLIYGVNTVSNRNQATCVNLDPDRSVVNCKGPVLNQLIRRCEPWYDRFHNN